VQLASTPGDPLEPTLILDEADHVLSTREGNFTGVVVLFERRKSGQVEGLVLDVSGRRITADLVGGVR